MAKSKIRRDLEQAHQEVRDLKNEIHKLMEFRSQESTQLRMERDHAREALATEQNKKLGDEAVDVEFVAKFAVGFLVELRKAGIANGKVRRG